MCRTFMHVIIISKYLLYKLRSNFDSFDVPGLIFFNFFLYVIIHECFVNVYTTHIQCMYGICMNVVHIHVCICSWSKMAAPLKHVHLSMFTGRVPASHTSGTPKSTRFIFHKGTFRHQVISFRST